MSAPQQPGVARKNRRRARNGPKTAELSKGGLSAAAVAVSDDRQQSVGEATNEPPGAVTHPPLDPDVVESAIQTAIESLEVLERHAHELADGFRWNHIAEANRGLADLMQSTQTMLVLANVTAEVAGANLQSLYGAGSQNVDENTRLAVTRMIECEEAQDWSALADTLDRDLVPALAQWRHVFSAMSKQSDSEPPQTAA